jgi:nitrate/nitrite transporter NarK
MRPRAEDSEVQTRTMRKIALRLMPVLLGLYIIALLSGTAAAAGIALVNSVGNLGGFVGPYLVGLMKDATGSTDGGLLTLAVILAVGSVLATRVAHDPAVERARRPSDRFSRQPRVAVPKRVRSVV